MRIGILLVGARGSGKTTWAEKIRLEHPKSMVFDRDKYLTTNYPGGFDPYSGGFCYALEEFWHMVALKVFDTDKKIFVFDYFTGSPHERRSIVVAEMRARLDFDRVYAHVLVTSRERTIRQYTEREASSHTSLVAAKAAATHDFELFQTYAKDMFPDSGKPPLHSFDGIRYIVPCQLILPGMPLI